MPKGKINVGSIIRAHRELLHLTQDGVSEKIGVSQQQYQRYEAGSSLPPLNILAKIMEYLKISPIKIFGDIKDPFIDLQNVDAIKIIKKSPEIGNFVKVLEKNPSIIKSYTSDEIILILKKISKLPPESKKNLLDIIDKLK